MDKVKYGDQHQTQGAVSYPLYTENAEVAALPPPPVSGNGDSAAYPTETKSKGNGFWRGCCAGWCCYCCLDACF